MSDNHAIIEAEAVAITEPEPVEVLHPLVQAMQARGDLTAENLERMMDLQERHEAKLAKAEFETARARLLDDLPAVVPKNRTVKYASTHYTYADLPQIIRHVMPALRAHGFSISWHNKSGKGHESVTCVLSHRAGHEATNTRASTVDPKKGQSSVQSAQSTVTYLQRQALLALLGIVTDDMPDADEHPAVDPTTVDIARNQRAVTWLRREHGISASDAEEHIGRPVSQWTADDLIKLREIKREV
ncbi:MAG: hypothetical protein GY700_01650 [Propionibacteriaceae bacterium]|nr:hypothetical protein [Propionibacteriaceae bacterium]